MLIGIDVGTTAVKAALFSPQGDVLKTWGERYPTNRPAPGQVEQDPQDWITRIHAALANLSADLPQGAISAIGLCSQVNTHVFVDAKGQALRPAMTWQDGRCAPRSSSA